MTDSRGSNSLTGELCRSFKKPCANVSFRSIELCWKTPEKNIAHEAKIQHGILIIEEYELISNRLLWNRTVDFAKYKSSGFCGVYFQGQLVKCA